MDLSEQIAGLDERNRAFVNEVSEILASSYKTKVVEKDGATRLTYAGRTVKRALISFKISGSALSVHVYADNINRYFGEMPEDMRDVIIKGRECDGIDKHPTCAGGYYLIADGKEHNKCRYMNFKFDVNDGTRQHIKRMILNEMSYR